MAKTAQSDFRGLTIFELLVILAVILGSILWALSFRTNLRNQTYDEIRKGRVSTIKENLRSYVLENGSFPSTEQFKDDETREVILATFLEDQGADSLHDPKEVDKLISYSAEPEGCEPETENPCTKVSIGLKLSGGDSFIKFAVKPGTELEYLQQTSTE